MTFAATIVGLLAGLALAAAALRSWETRQAARLLDRWRAHEVDRLGDDARRRSRAVVRGQVAEQLAPLTEAFPWAPEDARFLGKPMDYLVFDGLGEVRRGELRALREVVFVDVKTGRAGLTKSERRVQRCVEAGAVRLEAMPTVGDGR